MVAVFSLLVVAGWQLVAIAHAQNVDSRLPPCRKAGNMHRVKINPDDPNSPEALVLFGGKGHQFVTAEGRNGKGRKRGGKGGSNKYNVKSQTGFLGDTWIYDVSSGSWSKPPLVPSADGTIAPYGRWKFEGTSINDRELLQFGGCNTTTAFSDNDELWAFSFASSVDGQWRLIPTDNTPLRRRGHVVGANETHFIITGGKTWGSKFHGGTCDECITDTWIFPLSGTAPGAPRGKWVQGASFIGSCRWGSTGSVVKNAEGRSVFAVFGGRNLNPNAAWHSTAPDAYWYYNELYFYDFASDTWSLVSPDGPVPQKRDHHAEAVVGGDLFIFGGRLKETREPDADINDVWSFNAATNRWTEHKPVNQPPVGKYMPSMSEVMWEGKLALAVFGGETLPGSTKLSTMNDLWIFKIETREWINLTPNACDAKWTGIDSSPMTTDAETPMVDLSHGTCDGSIPSTDLAAIADRNPGRFTLFAVVGVVVAFFVAFVRPFWKSAGSQSASSLACDNAEPSAPFLPLA